MLFAEKKIKDCLLKGSIHIFIARLIGFISKSLFLFTYIFLCLKLGMYIEGNEDWGFLWFGLFLFVYFFVFSGGIFINLFMLIYRLSKDDKL